MGDPAGEDGQARLRSSRSTERAQGDHEVGVASPSTTLGALVGTPSATTTSIRARSSRGPISPRGVGPATNGPPADRAAVDRTGHPRVLAPRLWRRVVVGTRTGARLRRASR